LVKEGGEDMTNQITYENTPSGDYVLQIIRGTTEGVTISDGETLGQYQIAMKAGPQAFTTLYGGREEYTLKITFEDQSQLSFYQRFSSITHDQSLIFLQTNDLLNRYSVPTTMPNGLEMPSGNFSVGDDGVVRNAASNVPLMSDGREMLANYTIRSDSVVLDENSEPVTTDDGEVIQVVRGTQVVNSENTSETEDVVGCTGRNTPVGINLRGDLARNEFTPGSGVNPITFTGRHSNTGAGMGTLWGFYVGTALASTYLGFTNAAKEDPNDPKRKRFGVAGFMTGIAFGPIYGGLVGALAGLISGLIVEGIRATNKPRKMRFEYLDANNYPVARVEADDTAIEEDTAGLLEKVPLNKTHINPIWKECNEPDQEATSSVANNKTCNISQTPTLTYTPPDHCKYIAVINIDFTKYPDFPIDNDNPNNNEKHYQLTINTNTNTNTNNQSHIHFKQKPDNDPIFGSEWYIYWILFIVSLIVVTFIFQTILCVSGKSEYLTTKLQGETQKLYGVTSAIANKTKKLRDIGYKSLENAATRTPVLPAQPARSTKARFVAQKIGQGVATGAKMAVDLTSGVGSGVKQLAGVSTTAIGGAAQQGGKMVYDQTVKRMSNLKYSSAIHRSPNPNTNPINNNNNLTA
jgi:hypothetical protein